MTLKNEEKKTSEKKKKKFTFPAQKEKPAQVIEAATIEEATKKYLNKNT